MCHRGTSGPSSTSSFVREGAETCHICRQVHEKSILLPLLPLTLLADAERGLASWLPAVGAFSMYPLLRKDGLPIAYLGSLMIWAAIMWPSETAPTKPAARPKGAPAKRTGGRRLAGGVQTRPSAAASPDLTSLLAVSGLLPNPQLLTKVTKVGVCASVGAAVVVHMLDVLWTPPPRYPFLVDYLFVSLAFVHFAGAALYLNWRQWQLPGARPVVKIE